MLAYDVLALSWRNADTFLEGSFEGSEIPEPNCKRQVGDAVIVVHQHEERTFNALACEPVGERNTHLRVKDFAEVRFLERGDFSGLSQGKGLVEVFFEVPLDLRQARAKEEHRFVDFTVQK